MEWLKGIVGKLVTGAVVLAVAAGAISWWQTTPAGRENVRWALVQFSLCCAAVFVLPWLLTPLIARVSRLSSNSAGVALVAGVTIVELGVGTWLLRERLHGGATWLGVVAVTIVAGAYNLFTCDWIAERFE